MTGSKSVKMLAHANKMARNHHFLKLDNIIT